MADSTPATDGGEAVDDEASDDEAGDDGTATPEIDLPGEAFDAVLDALDDLDPGEPLRFEGFSVARDDEGGYVLADGGRPRPMNERELHEALTERAAAVTDWHAFERVVGEFGPRRAFLRWIEDADGETVATRYAALAEGIERAWGELKITATVTDRGERRYDVRHADDADVSVDDLEAHEDPLDARDLVTFDEMGRYRPLKTAPSLAGGWVFPDLGPRDLYETVETIYPATVANWHREREGELDVTHWRETMERQSGIYGVVKTWDRGEGHEHVDWVAEACCDDSQCLKRREWEYDEDTDLDVDGGDGVFPCREPCSVVVSAARKWTRLESEQPRTYEFELTPSEKEQVEDIIDAVADGRTDEIREADTKEGANRYRARFLRAKRFDDEGNLGGVPTDPDEE
ncbi:DR2241 family protein [Halorubrum distributum]|uniref:DR2241 family protein n=1 Tax=Halorubrum distributum TaxID=29283 RepID=UPI002954EF55|nr:DR2241 family protein [Halorubrum distributum]MDV7350212.1 DR2241 family protein [Halorubrum distributum]